MPNFAPLPERASHARFARSRAGQRMRRLARGGFAAARMPLHRGMEAERALLDLR
jgi:hypothetical protein